MQYEFCIDSNIRGAKAFINGNPQGMTDFNDVRRARTYQIRVSKFGYQD